MRKKTNNEYIDKLIRDDVFKRFGELFDYMRKESTLNEWVDRVSKVKEGE